MALQMAQQVPQVPAPPQLTARREGSVSPASTSAASSCRPAGTSSVMVDPRKGSSTVSCTTARGTSRFTRPQGYPGTVGNIWKGQKGGGMDPPNF